MAGPFRHAPARRGFGGTLRSKRTATFEAIENLLADSASLREISAADIDTACAAHAVDIARRFGSDRRDLYRRYLAYCLEDKALSESENADLLHLKALLHLDDADIAPVHDEVSQEVYGKAVREVLADLSIDADEEAFLRRLRGELHVPDAVAAHLLERGRFDAQDLALSQASSPDPVFASYRAPSGEFTGRSDQTFEAAVADALDKALIAIPGLHWFEVVQIAGYVGKGKPKGWHVTVRCGIAPESGR